MSVTVLFKARPGGTTWRNVVVVRAGVTPCDRVLVRVADVDDERPQFVSRRYVFALPENVAVGSFAGVVVAVDRDSEPSFADFRYQLNSSAAFAIDPRSGVVVTRAPLDRETLATHRLTVTVRSVPPTAAADRTTGTGNDDGRADEATVVVRVDDVNDNAPYFRFPRPTNHTLSVPSTSGVGSTVGRVVAVDADAGDNARLTYFLVSPERRGVFRLAADSGELTVVGNLSTSPRRLRFVVVLVILRASTLCYMRPRPHQSIFVRTCRGNTCPW